MGRCTGRDALIEKHMKGSNSLLWLEISMKCAFGFALDTTWSDFRGRVLQQWSSRNNKGTSEKVGLIEKLLQTQGVIMAIDQD